MAKKLATDWARENFTALPEIAIRSTVEINGAMGAFAKATNTIYISREYLAQNVGNPEAVASVLLEEAGHYVDSRINDFEAPGDEGAIFSALVCGESLSEQELQRLRAEDDFATITLDGQTIQIEQATFTGTNGNDTLPASGTDNSGNDTFNPLRGNDIVNGGAGSNLLVVDYSANTYAGPTYTQGIKSSVSSSSAGGFNGYLYAYTDNNGNSDEVSFSNIEHFQVTGANSADTLIVGTGNDTLNGNGGDDILNGRAGIDTLIGGNGNDAIAGGLGNDLLTGGAGSDRFTFNDFNEGIDTIVDLETVDDIYVSAAGFGGGLVANNAAITTSQFLSGSGVTVATNSSQRFIYNTSNGALFFDADGNGTGSAAMQIATLTNAPGFANTDILVIA